MRPLARAGLVPADLVVATLLVAAVLLGGGGSPAPLPEMVLQIAGFVALVLLAWLDRGGAPWPRLAFAVAVLLVALPAVQLVPLPPALWQGLPGREVERQALALVGREAAWMPWSVSPPRTWAALLALTTPAILLAAVARASLRGRSLTLAALAAMALVSVLVGAGQLAGGDHGPLRFYAMSHREDLTGFQANRNAEADVLIAGLLAVAALAYAFVRRARQVGAALAAGAAVLLVTGTVLTASRAGIVLLLLVLASLGAIMLWPRLRAGIGKREIAAGIAGLAGLAALVVVLARDSALGRVVGRFSDGATQRPELWRDTLFAIGQYWPWGSGIGTFVPVFIASEPLESVDFSLPNRAHNDFLELALEAGVPGIAALILVTGVLAWRLAIRWRAARSGEERAQLGFAGAVLGLVALHSIVDYPLRSMALASVAGAAAGMILAPRHRVDASGSGRLEI